MWDTAAEEGLQYHNQIADCLAQCAIVFGGGIAPYGGYTLLELLRWTNRAITACQSGESA